MVFHPFSWQWFLAVVLAPPRPGVRTMPPTSQWQHFLASQCKKSRLSIIGVVTNEGGFALNLVTKSHLASFSFVFYYISSIFTRCLRRLVGVFVLALPATRPFCTHAAHFGRNTTTNADRESTKIGFFQATCFDSDGRG